MGTRYGGHGVAGSSEDKSARQALLLRFLRLTTPTTDYFSIVDLHPHSVSVSKEGLSTSVAKATANRDPNFLETFLVYTSRARERARTCLDALNGVLERKQNDIQLQANAAEKALRNYLQYALELLKMESEGTIYCRDARAFHWAFPYVRGSEAPPTFSAQGLAFEVLNVFVALGGFCRTRSRRCSLLLLNSLIVTHTVVLYLNVRVLAISLGLR